MSALPVKVRCTPCDGTGCEICGKRGWTLAVLLMDCPRCEGTEEVEGLVHRQVRPGSLLARTYVGSVRCPDCRGEGVVPRPCSQPGCEEPAVRWPEDGDPFCEQHDVCDLCQEAKPVLGEANCETCARHLAGVVAPVTAAA